MKIKFLILALALTFQTFAMESENIEASKLLLSLEIDESKSIRENFSILLHSHINRFVDKQGYQILLNTKIIELMKKYFSIVKINQEFIEIAKNKSTQSYFARSFAKFLISLGADINAVDEFGNNALIYACGNDLYYLVTLYVELGINIEKNSNQELTALCIAATLENSMILRYLLDKGANVNPKTAKSPLHMAIEYNRQENANILIEADADIYELNEFEQTPLIAAQFNLLASTTEQIKNKLTAQNQ
ncbi:ankyrin repeat domain-containing protein [Candidatus Dependentiae bacterium]|nr:ankyrin repeat domain-containing protein [Candidatus Dependentiae bacterium]